MPAPFEPEPDLQEARIELVPASDSKLSESYELLGELGSGGMGCVLKAKHKILGQYVAIKKISEKGSKDESHLKRFTNEAKAASLLKHENIAGLREFGIDKDGSPYAVMDFVSGQSLSQLIDSQENGLDPSTTLQIAMQVARGLAHAHSQGIIHRDIKPSNIMVESNEETAELKATIVDFGIAKITSSEATKLTQTGEVYGSPSYISPEQALGQQVDCRADIYSLGCVIYECLSGKTPYQGENAMQTAMKHINAPIPDLKKTCKKDLPPGLAELVSICLQKEPESRYHSAGELLAALSAISEGRKASLHGRASAKGFLRRHRSWIITANVILVMLLCAFTVSQSLNRSAQISQPGASPSEAEAAIVRDLPLSDFAKLAVTNDMGKAYADYNAGKYLQSAFALSNTNNILKAEIPKLEELIKNAENKDKRRKLRADLYQLRWFIAENLVHISDCLRRSNDLARAMESIEEAMPIFEEAANRVGTSNPSIKQAYAEYLSVLEKLSDKSKYKLIKSQWEKLNSRGKHAH